MKKTIGITSDLADIFIIQALKDGYCNYLTTDTQKVRYQHSKYMIQRGQYSDAILQDGFDRLTQLLIMYDNITFPILNGGYYLQGRITNIAQIDRPMPVDFYSDRQLDVDELSDVQATSWKPIVMSAIKNIRFSNDYIAYMKKQSGSIEAFYSYMFDRMYNHANASYNLEIEKDALSAYCLRAENDPLDYPCAERYILSTDKILIAMMKELMLYFRNAENKEYDYYSTIFNNFSTATNTNEAYIIIREKISDILTLQPAFNNLTEVLSFREKKRRDILALRNEISNIEELLRTGGTEAAINQAAKDVKLANEALIRGNATKRTAQIATYLSVPIALLEFLTFGTPFSMAISIVGTIAQLKSDLENRQSNWLFVAR